MPQGQKAIANRCWSVPCGLLGSGTLAPKSAPVQVEAAAVMQGCLQIQHTNHTNASPGIWTSPAKKRTCARSSSHTVSSSSSSLLQLQYITLHTHMLKCAWFWASVRQPQHCAVQRPCMCACPKLCSGVLSVHTASSTPCRCQTIVFKLTP